MKLLLAIEGSSPADAVVQELLRRPWPPGSAVRVLMVVEIPYPVPLMGEAASVPAITEAQDVLESEARASVQTVRRRLQQCGLALDSRVRHGSAGAEIVAEAKDWGADLVLVGAHGHGGIERFFMGDVAQYVVAHAPCSVEVVRMAAPADASAR